MTLYEAPRSNLTPTWTEERVRRLTSLAITNGYTADQISDVMGISRGAVIGKLKRLGVSLARARTEPDKPRPKVERRAPLSHRLRKPAPATELPKNQQVCEVMDLPPDTSEFACTISELETDMCRWPLGEPAADMQYCGAPCVGSWCMRHRRIVWNSSGRRER